jgi:DNA-binding CsgD family transcriptional regulator
MTPRDHLTSKEIEVATLVWQGLTNREIGKLTGTTEQVVKNHLRSAFDKLGVWSRLELAMYVASHGGKSWTEESDGLRDLSLGRCSGQESRAGGNAQTPRL